MTELDGAVWHNSYSDDNHHVPIGERKSCDKANLLLSMGLSFSSAIIGVDE
jgi:hypothetical protein